jgi:hypothetical protein
MKAEEFNLELQSEQFIGNEMRTVMGAWAQKKDLFCNRYQVDKQINEA